MQCQCIADQIADVLHVVEKFQELRLRYFPVEICVNIPHQRINALVVCFNSAKPMGLHVY